MTEIKFWRAVGGILMLGLVLLMVFHVWSVIVPFLIGIVLAYLVNPSVEYFVSMGWRRDRVVVVLYLIFLSIGTVAVSWIWPKLISEANTALSEIPSYAKALDAWVNEFNVKMRDFLKGIVGSEAKNFAIPFNPSQILEGLFKQLPERILGAAHFGMWVLIIPFVAFFGLSHGKRWIDGLFSITPAAHVEGLLGLFAEVNATLGAYVRGVLFESTCVGIMTMFGLMLLGIEGAVLLGIITGMVNFIPFMAPVIGGTLALGAAYFQYGSLSILVAVGILIIGTRLVDDFVLIPFIVGSSVKIHPVAIVFAILAGVELGGFLGLVFAIPMAVVIKVLLSIMLRSRKETIMLKQQHVYS